MNESGSQREETASTTPFNSTTAVPETSASRGSGEHSGSDTSAQHVATVEDLQQAIGDGEAVTVVGRGTKSALAPRDPSRLMISTARLSGILEYEPSEFTFTALAGTPLAEIAAVLAEKNQYLPFDPPLVERGATLGGTVAAGLSGPGRLRYGGLRDFVLGAEFIAGDGQRIRSGGKVVKNAAGFDIPKLLVGSCGRLGALASLTFKVFPQPVARHTYQVTCDDHPQAATVIAALARGRWELDAIDYRAGTHSVWVRMGGSEAVCQAMAADISATLDGVHLQPVAGDQAGNDWRQVNEFEFASGARCLVKVPCTLKGLAPLAAWCDQRPQQAALHVSAAGGVSWLLVAPEQLAELDTVLHQLDAAGLLIWRPTGSSGDQPQPASAWLGPARQQRVETAIKQAMDPPGRFPPLLSSQAH